MHSNRWVLGIPHERKYGISSSPYKYSRRLPSEGSSPRRSSRSEGDREISARNIRVSTVDNERIYLAPPPYYSRPSILAKIFILRGRKCGTMSVAEILL